MATFTGIGKLLKDFAISTLNTTSKTIPGAINELKSLLGIVGTDYSSSTSTTMSTTGIDNATNGASLTLPAGTYVIVGRWTFQTGTVSGARNLQVAIANASGIVAHQRVYAASGNYATLSIACIAKNSAQTTYWVRGSSSGAISAACTTEIRAVRIK